MRFRIENATVSFQGNVILDHCDFEIRGKEKIALVGVNGAGKSTLLHIISGQQDVDQDDKYFGPSVWMARNTTVGLLEQNPFLEKDITVRELIQEVCPVSDPYSKEFFDFEMEYQRLFTRFGFQLQDTRKRVGDFSGGEQTKIALIRLLLMKPDILLLDEPTNHLDIAMIRWLEEYISQYEKAVVMVSHDRYFLDQTANVVYELDQGKTKRYAGNYTAYKKEREAIHRRLVKQYKEQEEEIQRLTKLIESFKHKPKKAAMARSKKKMLERMDTIPNPDQFMSYVYPGDIQPARISSKQVFDCQKLLIGYDHPLQRIHMTIKRGQKIGIIGANGIGKTTFLKTLAGFLPPYSGNILQGNHVEASYYDQMTAEISGEERILQAFQQAFPSYSLGDCRKVLARFLFKDHDMGKQISSLSGGEKCRFSFSKLLEEKPNVLLLDEPTNHLDIPSKEVLESAFSNYKGTLLFITHDRYFLQQLAESLLIFEKDRVIYFPYDYKTYLESQQKEKKRQLQGIRSMDEENELLQQSLSQVPEKSRIQSARFNQEQAYTDWQLDLMTEDFTLARWRFEKILEELPVNDLRLLESYQESFGLSREDYESLVSRYFRAEENYTEACISWYEKYMEYQDAFADYRDA